MKIKDIQKNYTSPFENTLNRDQVLYIINIVWKTGTNMVL